MSEGSLELERDIELDHLVVACRTLDAGREWSEATFGATPVAGGRHALMGTHNLLLATSSPRFPRSYLELIAIDPDAQAPAHPRWFEFDQPDLQAQVALVPRLVHWVARTTDIVTAAAALRRAGFDPGPVIDAERKTPLSVLRWRIAIAVGGRRHAGGAVPLLIEWGNVHPTDALPESGMALQSLTACVAPSLAAWLGVTASAISGPEAQAHPAPIVAEFSAPRGAVTVTAPAASTNA